MNVLTVLLIFVLIGVMVERMLYDKYVRALYATARAAHKLSVEGGRYIAQQEALISALRTAAIEAQFGQPTEITVYGTVWRFEKAQVGSGLAVIVKVDPPIGFATSDALPTPEQLAQAQQFAKAYFEPEGEACEPTS